MLIGATMNEQDLAVFAPMLAGNNIMRIFPQNVAAAGGTVKALPAWSDARFAYCKQAGAVPFVSTKVDGNADAIDVVRRQLLTMPDWISRLYITDRHEPEGDLTAEQFKINFARFLAMINSLPPDLRSLIRCGPVLTRTWTERAGAGRSYDTYDPGTGDFLGVDMYVESGTAKQVVSPASLPTPAAFLAQFKAYRKTSGDTRDRIIPEYGVIGMPGDPDGTARAAWIRGLHTEAATCSPATTGWNLAGMIWWNATGKATGEVAQIGQRRDFPLHLRTEPAAASSAAGRSATAAAAVPLPGDPPAPVAAFNDIFTAENTPTVPTFGDQVSYSAGWRDGRKTLAGNIADLLRADALL